MDGSGNVVGAGKLGSGDLDLFEPDTSDGLTDGLLQFEPVRHRCAEMLQPTHPPGDSCKTVVQRPIRRTYRSHFTAPALRDRIWPHRPRSSPAAWGPDKPFRGAPLRIGVGKDIGNHRQTVRASRPHAVGPDGG